MDSNCRMRDPGEFLTGCGLKKQTYTQQFKSMWSIVVTCSPIYCGLQTSSYTRSYLKRSYAEILADTNMCHQKTVASATRAASMLALAPWSNSNGIPWDNPHAEHMGTGNRLEIREKSKQQSLFNIILRMILIINHALFWTCVTCNRPIFSHTQYLSS